MSAYQKPLAKITLLGQPLYSFGRSTDGPYDYDIGSGWIFHRKGGNCAPVSEALGWIYIRKYPWVYFIDGGWRWVVEAGIEDNSNAWWFYQPDFGWFWTTRDIYPWVYLAGTGWNWMG